MHYSVVESLISDAHFDILFPATDSSEPLDILNAPQRPLGFYDELLSAYLLFRPSQASSAPKVTHDMMKDIAEHGLDIQLTAIIGDGNEIGHPTSASSTTGGGLPAPPPALHHLNPFPHRNRAATTGPPVAARRGGKAPTPHAAGYLASPKQNRRGTGFKIPSSGGRSPLSSSSVPLKDSPDFKPEDIIYSYTYVPDLSGREPIILSEQKCCLFPFQVPLAFTKARSREDAFATLRISIVPKSTKRHFSVEGPEMCDPEDFDTPNLLTGLADDPYFNANRLPTHSMTHHIKRLSSSQHLPSARIIVNGLVVRPVVNLTLSIVDAGLDNLLMSLALENKTSIPAQISIESVKADMTNAIISGTTSANADDLLLKSMDEVNLLHNVTLLDETFRGVDEGPFSGSETPTRPLSSSVPNLNGSKLSRIKRILSLVVKVRTNHPGARGQLITAKYFTQLLFGNNPESRTMLNVAPLYGRKTGTPKEIRIVSENVEKDLQVSFSVMSKVRLRQIFTVQAFFVNQSSRARHLSIIIPAKSERPEEEEIESLRNADSAINLHMDDEDFLRTYYNMEKREASLVCLENTVQLSPLNHNTCQTVNLHFVAIKGMIHSIDMLQLADRESGQIMDLGKVLEVHIESDAS
ncbi:TRAPP trafficking subunit Trs65-domain-containing protein [Phlyctochytrium arcticum]|nr:TRAPP trafficking subunit Trs65-domain-containing protein [Phlyctochytrium arcticum]